LKVTDALIFAFQFLLSTRKVIIKTTLPAPRVFKCLPDFVYPASPLPGSHVITSVPGSLAGIDEAQTVWIFLFFFMSYILLLLLFFRVILTFTFDPNLTISRRPTLHLFRHPQS